MSDMNGLLELGAKSELRNFSNLGGIEVEIEGAMSS